ncbi:hypothetical protein JCM10449v2_001715 [Rhodotorula kratochvilovae]
MEPSRKTATPAGPHGLVRLPEELVDLVCSFVRDFDVEYAVTTLGSLCLTSRLFLSPAQRALLYDPSRILATRQVEHAHLLLNRVLRRPELGKQVKRLEGLIDVFNRVSGLSFEHEHPDAFLNWAISLLRCCPNLEAVAVWPDAAAGWIEELDRLPRLRHLTVQRSLAHDPYHDDGIPTTPAFLSSLHLSRLNSLTLRPATCHDYVPPLSLLLPDVHLVVEGCALFDEELNLDLSNIRHLTLRPSYPIQTSHGLPPQIEMLVYQPRGAALSRREGCRKWQVDGWVHLSEDSHRLYVLRVVILESVEVNLWAFETITTTARSLGHLELRNSAWDADDWSGYVGCERPMDDRLVDALRLLPRLRVLHLGTIPVSADGIVDTQVHCRLHGVELEWRTLQVRPSPSPSFPGAYIVAGPIQVELPGDNTVSTVVSRWPYRRRAMSAYGESDAESHSSSSSSSSATSSASFDVPALPRISRTPTPRLDDDILASYSTNLARAAADEQVYLAAPADEPRLEGGYQAGDEADEDVDGEEYEPWRRWGEACDVGAADRAWAEYDDEGQWECAGECWE